MNEEYGNSQDFWDAERLSDELERDYRRYPHGFSTEEAGE